MFALMFQSGCTRISNWAVEYVLGSLARVAVLTLDDDMCLLLRVEMPRSNTKAAHV
jgi:hypothetical protein